MKRVVVAVMILTAFAGGAWAQAGKLGGSVTAEFGVQTTSQSAQLIRVGAGMCLFPVRYFGAGGDFVYGFKSYDTEATSGSLTQTATTDVSGFALDGYFAPHIDFDRGRLYPIAGLTIYSLKTESSAGGTTVKYDYGTGIGLVFGLGAEVLVKNQIVLGIKLKERMVTGTEEENQSGVKYTTDTPIGGPEAVFTIGLNF